MTIVANDARNTWTGNGWQIRLEGEQLVLDDGERPTVLGPDRATEASLSRSWFRWELRLNGKRHQRLRGLRSAGARELAQSIKLLGFVPEIEVAKDWHAAATALLDRAVSEQRWIARDQVSAVGAGRPDTRLQIRLSTAGIWGLLSAADQAAAAFVDVDFEQMVAETNDAIVAAELVARRDFFDNIEASPLTDEQAKAVICYDNRVQVLAAAGSGKTSVMVARAAYAVHRGFTTPDRILLLAFNRAAAKELQERIDDRLEAVGIDATGLRASTFHSFGLKVIGQATKAKPRLAAWAEPGRDTRTVEEIVDGLKDSDRTYRYKWDLYRLLFAAAPDTVDGGRRDGYDRDTAKTGFATFAGEVVKSAGEQMIANWLYLNGVRYEYERPYSVRVADATHSQYHPDFYYPAIDAWHEHWAIGRDGLPPADFVGYGESMRWKQQLHRENDTRLVESTWVDVVFGSGLADLETDLTELGLVFDWNPDRTVHGPQPVKHEALSRLMRTFMSHVKSNSLTRADLDRRLHGQRKSLSGFRTRLFLDLYWPIHEEWERRLRAGDSVDFDDMLGMAAGHLESGAVVPRYDLVMVDEFQDASQLRARLALGLVARPGRHLLAVGDDWQSINRFAGADISLMTGFNEWFGEGLSLHLTKTFRCPQAICDTAAHFVQKNPAQFRKEMTSTQSVHGTPIEAILADKSKPAVARFLERLSNRIEEGSIEPGRDGKVSVLILGRYKFDKDVVPEVCPPHLDVTFRTVHGSKGLEADYVLLPRMTSGNYGFPSSITDDPVLDLVMVAPDEYSNAEERRLFYVALTRARRQVTLIAQRGNESAFVTELMGDGAVTIIDDENGAEVVLCGGCLQGTMVLRTSRYGEFYGCSTFPACDHTRKCA